MFSNIMKNVIWHEKVFTFMNVNHSLVSKQIKTNAYFVFLVSWSRRLIGNKFSQDGTLIITHNCLANANI